MCHSQRVSFQSWLLKPRSESHRDQDVCLDLLGFFTFAVSTTSRNLHFSIIGFVWATKREGVNLCCPLYWSETPLPEWAANLLWRWNSSFLNSLSSLLLTVPDRGTCVSGPVQELKFSVFPLKVVNHITAVLLLEKGDLRYFFAISVLHYSHQIQKAFCSQRSSFPSCVFSRVTGEGGGKICFSR